MGRDKHRLLPNSPCYLSLFLECPPAAFTITLCLFLTRFIEQGRRKRGRRECKETVYYKEDKKRKEKKPVTTITTTPADRSLVMLRFLHLVSCFTCVTVVLHSTVLVCSVLRRMLHCPLIASGFWNWQVTHRSWCGWNNRKRGQCCSMLKYWLRLFGCLEKPKVGKQCTSLWNRDPCFRGRLFLGNDHLHSWLLVLQQETNNYFVVTLL